MPTISFTEAVVNIIPTRCSKVNPVMFNVQGVSFISCYYTVYEVNIRQNIQKWYKTMLLDMSCALICLRHTEA